MKKFMQFTCALAVVLAILASAAASAVPIESNAQYKGQISYFKDALDEFGAANPDQVVKLWVKGDETRNGVFKYAVACDSLKKQLISRWGDPEKNFWNIGVSSPWLAGHEIVSNLEVSPTEMRYTVKYYWQTSAGPELPTLEHLTITKEKDKWCVSKVSPLPAVLYLSSSFKN